MNTFLLQVALLWISSCLPLVAHEASGRAGHKEGDEAHAVETDLCAGPNGYWHGGIGVLQPLGSEYQAGLTLHVVREEAGGSWFPSLGGEFARHFENGVELEGFSFGYFPVERQHAWAAGARLVKPFAAGGGWTISPFCGPTFARVRTRDTAVDTPADVNHVLLLGGVLLARGPVEANLFGSHSWFSRDTRDLETHVDLEEMTHLAAYENNDGFARNSVGGEIKWAATQRFSVSVRYAAIFYPGESVRHSVTLLPSVSLGERLACSVGVQWLRGAGFDRALLASGFSWEF